MKDSRSASRRPWRRGRKGELWCDVTALISAHKAHGTLQILRIMELDINANVLGKAASEKLGLLVRCKVPCVRHPVLERLLVGCDGSRERQPSQFGQVVGSKRRPKALVAQAFKLIPSGLAGVALKDIIPLLGSPRKMEGCEPHSVDIRRALGTEKAIATIQPSQWIIFAIISRK